MAHHAEGEAHVHQQADRQRRASGTAGQAHLALDATKSTKPKKRQSAGISRIGGIRLRTPGGVPSSMAISQPGKARPHRGAPARVLAAFRGWDPPFFWLLGSRLGSFSALSVAKALTGNWASAQLGRGQSAVSLQGMPLGPGVLRWPACCRAVAAEFCSSRAVSAEAKARRQASRRAASPGVVLKMVFGQSP